MRRLVKIMVCQTCAVRSALFLLALSVGMGLVADVCINGACMPACNNGVICTYDHTIGPPTMQKGWIYEVGCNRLINSDTSDGNKTFGSVQNQYKTATVNKICDKTTDNLQGSAQSNCAADADSDWAVVSCAEKCITK